MPTGAFVHDPVGAGSLVKREFEVEDLARVDPAVPDPVDEFGRYWRTGAGGADGLQHRLLGADGLDPLREALAVPSAGNRLATG